MVFFEAVNSKQLRSTVSLTAGRGRGKSAATGIAVAGAVFSGLSNIFVTAPHPSNLHTLFQFTIQALEVLGY
jgi:N-acetyltransferase 10